MARPAAAIGATPDRALFTHSGAGSYLFALADLHLRQVARRCSCASQITNAEVRRARGVRADIHDVASRTKTARQMKAMPASPSIGACKVLTLAIPMPPGRADDQWRVEPGAFDLWSMPAALTANSTRFEARR